MKLGHSVCLNKILYMFENRSYWVKSWSLGQIIDDRMLATLLLNAILHDTESSGEQLQDHYGRLLKALVTAS